MFRRKAFWHYLTEAFAQEHFQEQVLFHEFDKTPFSLKDLHYLKSKLQSSSYVKTHSALCRKLLESIVYRIQTITKNEAQEKEIKKELQRYDFDRYFNRVENNDFRWYLSPKGYSNSETLKAKTIHDMYDHVNRKLGKHFVFSGNKSSYHFHELDYETKK